MIVDFLLNTLIQFFTWVISGLPNFNGLPVGITNAVTFFQTYWDKASLIFPMDTAFQIIALMVGIDIAVFVWQMWWFSYKKIPGKFT